MPWFGAVRGNVFITFQCTIVSATMSWGDNNTTTQQLDDFQQEVTFSDKKDLLPSVFIAGPCQQHLIIGIAQEADHHWLVQLRDP